VLTTTDGWIREVSNGGYYVHKKLIPKKSDNGSLSLSTSAASTVKNYHVIRYADVLLWYAEALIETGEYAKGGEYINQIRARAANSYLGAADPETLAPATEGHRWYDLTRWGIAHTEINKFVSFEKAYFYEIILSLAIENKKEYEKLCQ